MAAAQGGLTYTPGDDSHDLQFSETIQPGTKIVVHRADGTTKDCSIGWIVTSATVEAGLGALTAGHCGNPGDEVSVTTPGFHHEPIGTVTAVNYDEENPEEGADYGLITLSPQAAAKATGTPQGKSRLTAPRSVDLSSNQTPYVCSRGHHGTTCGSLDTASGPSMILSHGTTQDGDSGGAVWEQSTEDPGQITPLGIVYGVRAGDGVAASKPLMPALEQWGLSIAP